jgi:hypothetical protein
MSKDDRLDKVPRSPPNSIHPSSRDHADRDKNVVVAGIAELVRTRHAEWKRLPNGEVGVRLKNGRVFRLGETGLVRWT